MKIPPFPYLLLGSVLLLLTFAPVSTSVAAEPQINTFHSEGTFVAADCSDFLAIDDFVQDLSRIRFFDNEGNLVGVRLFATCKRAENPRLFHERT